MRFWVSRQAAKKPSQRYTHHFYADCPSFYVHPAVEVPVDEYGDTVHVCTRCSLRAGRENKREWVLIGMLMDARQEAAQQKHRCENWKRYADELEAKWRKVS